LLERLESSEAGIEVRVRDLNKASPGISNGQPDQLTLFAGSADRSGEGANFGAGIAWTEQGRWKTKATPLGKYLTLADAELFAICMAAKEARRVLHRMGKREADIGVSSQEALTTVSRAEHWVSPLGKDIGNQARQLTAQGCRLTLSGLPDNGEVGRAAQQPREMSLTYVQRCVKSAGQQLPKLNKHIGGAKKSVAARYLQ
jgi:hypothetical protein